MVPDFDAISSVASTTGTSLTFSHTTSGSNRFLFVLYSGDTVSDVVTGITYNGVAMTKIGSSVQCPGDRYMGVYYLIAPASGANNVVISASASKSIRSYAVSYTGAKQSGQPDSNSSNTGSGISLITGTLTTVADNCWMVMFSKDNDGTGTYSGGTGTTARVTSDAGGLVVVDSNGALTPAGSHSVTTNFGGSRNAAYIFVSFAPAASVANTSNFFELL